MKKKYTKPRRIKVNESCGNDVVADEIPVEAWERIGKFGVHLLCRILNSVLKTDEIWRRNISAYCGGRKGRQTLGVLE